jgi:predicted GNAT family acetyltransferase
MSAALVIERYADANAFLAAAESWLLEAEAENNLMLGIASHWRERPPADPRPYWASIRDPNGIVGCACRTPPYHVVLTRMPPAAIALLAEDVAAAYASVSGVNGPTAVAEAFGGAWIARHGGTRTTRMRMRLHELTSVSLAGPLAAGALRKVVDAELPLAGEWMDEFVREVGVQRWEPGWARKLVDRGQLFFWVDAGTPRAMAACVRETRSGCAVNAVYTPAPHRRRGYATAAVATLSDTLLKAGRRFCCLYTDLANPTSNSIYAKIGYRPIRDDVEIAFEP